MTCVCFEAIAAFGGKLIDVQLGQHGECPEEHDAQRHAQQRAIVAERSSDREPFACAMSHGNDAQRVRRLERHDEQACDPSGHRDADQNERRKPPSFLAAYAR